MTSLESARLVIKALNELDISFMVVGSLSSNYYAIPRSTKDADFVIETDARIESLRQRLLPSLVMDGQIGFETKLMTTKYVFRHSETPFHVEMFLLSKDPHDRQRFKRRVEHQDEGLRVYVPTAEDVIIQKLRWSRWKDLSDVADIVEVQAGKLDWDYLYMWADSHGTRGTLEKIRDNPGSFE